MEDVVAMGARTLVGMEAPSFAREERTPDADIGTVVIEVATEVTSRVLVGPWGWWSGMLVTGIAETTVDLMVTVM